ncbi:hypothetical protein T484DRAFT_1645764, partial [Baffinella frigidus]
MGDGSCLCFLGWSGVHCAVQDVTFSIINTTASCIVAPGYDVCVCAAGFTGEDGGPCEPCQLGAYKVGNGSGLCQPCGDGTYSTSMPATSDSACKSCPVDSWCTAGLRNDCPAGRESSKGTSSDVACWCPAGLELKSDGSCQSCAANSFCPGGSASQSCPNNLESVAGIQSEADCTCAAGLEYVADSNDCQSCAAGTFTGVSGRSACQPCDPGTSNDGDRTRCSPCEANSFCPGGSESQSCPNNLESAAGIQSEADCTCAAGLEYVADSNDCQSCAAGTVKGGVDRGQCSSCPANYF